MADYGRATDEGGKLGDDVGEQGCRVNVGLGDARVADDEVTQIALRVDEGLEGVELLVSPEPYGTDLCDRLRFGRKAGRFKVEGYPLFFLDWRSCRQ